MGMDLRIWDVNHGACAMMFPTVNGQGGRLAMIDSGCTPTWRPSRHIRQRLGRTQVDYLFITNADQDHMSDLEGLWDEDVRVATLTRNQGVTPADLRRIKEEAGTLTDDCERFLTIHEGYTHPVSEPFNGFMGGITMKTFGNSYPRFQDTNNLSLAVFFSFAGFKILFPGDLEQEGWLALLEREDFRSELAGITILVASHHGRENGYCREVFDHCAPRAVIMSDKAIVHDTQHMAATYRAHVTRHWPSGVYVATTSRQRHVLTTRRDGHIDIEVSDTANFVVSTEYAG